MNIKQELILRTICAFESNGYAHFILSNLNPYMPKHIKSENFSFLLYLNFYI